MRPAFFSFGLLALAILAGGCRQETAFAPPAQVAAKPYFARVMLDMTPGMPPPFGATINTGVEQPVPGLNWRWMSSPASFSYQLADRQDWYLDMYLTVVDKVQEQKGPQRLVVLLNGKELTRAALDKPGAFRLHMPAEPGPKPTVELQVEPCLPEPFSPPYCVLLHNIGWSRELPKAGELK